MRGVVVTNTTRYLGSGAGRGGEGRGVYTARAPTGGDTHMQITPFHSLQHIPQHPNTPTHTSPPRSEQLCSLREGVERFAVSVIWTLRRTPRRAAGPAPDRCGRCHDFEVLDTWFGRTLIRSRHQLHYQQVGGALKMCKHLFNEANPMQKSEKGSCGVFVEACG